MITNNMTITLLILLDHFFTREYSLDTTLLNRTTDSTNDRIKFSTANWNNSFGKNSIERLSYDQSGNLINFPDNKTLYSLFVCLKVWGFLAPRFRPGGFRPGCVERAYIIISNDLHVQGAWGWILTTWWCPAKYVSA